MSLIRLTWPLLYYWAGVSVWCSGKFRAVLPCIRAQAGSEAIVAARQMIVPGTADVKGIFLQRVEQVGNGELCYAG